LLLFLEKEGRLVNSQKTTTTHIPLYLGSASPRVGYQAAFCEAELRFLLLFLEKEGAGSTLKDDHYTYTSLLGVGFTEVWVSSSLLRSRTTLFASFSGKRRSLGQPLKPTTSFV
jgi:hypothetical protein